MAPLEGSSEAPQLQVSELAVRQLGNLLQGKVPPTLVEALGSPLESGFEGRLQAVLRLADLQQRIASLEALSTRQFETKRTSYRTGLGKLAIFFGSSVEDFYSLCPFPETIEAAASLTPENFQAVRNNVEERLKMGEVSLGEHYENFCKVVRDNLASTQRIWSAGLAAAERARACDLIVGKIAALNQLPSTAEQTPENTVLSEIVGGEIDDGEIKALLSYMGTQDIRPMSVGNLGDPTHYVSEIPPEKTITGPAEKAAPVAPREEPLPEASMHGRVGVVAILAAAAALAVVAIRPDSETDRVAEALEVMDSTTREALTLGYPGAVTELHLPESGPFEGFPQDPNDPFYSALRVEVTTQFKEIAVQNGLAGVSLDDIHCIPLPDETVTLVCYPDYELVSPEGTLVFESYEPFLLSATDVGPVQMEDGTVHENTQAAIVMGPIVMD